MFSILYNTGLSVYKTLLGAVAPFNTKARQWLNGQDKLLDRIAQALPDRQTPDGTKPLAWFHAASLGEFEQGRPVMEAFREQYPNYIILLTFFSPSGYEVRNAYAGADYIFYLPLDTPRNARQFMTLVRPNLAFFIKYEFWANYLRELKAARVPTVLFSAIFRPNQLFFKPYGGFYRNLLPAFNHILVQNQESVELLRGIGVTNVTLAGDTRFDRVAQVAAARREIPLARVFKQEQPLLVVGSAWPDDMDVLIPFLNRFAQPLKVIIAPHEIDSEQIERWRAQLNAPSVRYSEVSGLKDERAKEDAVSTDASVHSFALSSARYLFIDNIGMLTSLYQYGEFAFIGGAYKQGLHNILEAATFGMPLFFGPEYAKFQEAVELVGEGAAFPVRDVAELEAVFSQQYADPAAAARISRAYVQRNVGATGKVMQVIHTFLSR